MTTPILHHYPSSPYAEVVRTAFGLKGLSWRSAEQSVIMPRPFLTPLTGGYRRIPVLQIGADIICDTQMILRALDRLYPASPVCAPGHMAAAWMARGYSERVWFQISVGVIFAEIGDGVPEAFKADRRQLSGREFDTKAMKAMAPALADQWRAIAGLADAQLRAGGAFLDGVRAGLTDLAVWLNVWFLRNATPQVYARLTGDMAALAAWADRMAAIGHGEASPIAPEDALAEARAAAPQPPPESPGGEAQGLAPGDAVLVAADDYGRDPIAGVIAAIDPFSISLLRQTPEAGAVCVHFPRAGFFVSRA
jgi:glutathione S-transferase